MKKLIAALLFLPAPLLPGQAPGKGFRYHSPAEIAGIARELAVSAKENARVYPLAQTFGGKQLELIEIGRETKLEKRTNPAILVVANLEGTTPMASEAALRLMRLLLEDPSRYTDVSWFILPLGNPDGAARFFEKPLWVDGRNQRPWNDDMDDAIDEDGPEDLNGDGYITQMRVKDPDGTLMPDEKEPRILRRADPAKGERGLYKVYPEGLDNDGDGQYNEDAPGGTNIGITFPHLYPQNQSGAGAWTGSEAETYSLMQFVTAHPEIAMVMTYGSTNFCLSPMKSGRKSTLNLSSIRIPDRYARMLNADPQKTYSLEEVKEMMKAIVPPGTTVDDSMVAGMLDAGAVVNPIDSDLKVFTSLSEKYKEFLKKGGLTSKRLEPARDKDGSFELWAYYHLGLPSFSQDFWGLPEAPKSDTAARKSPDAGTQVKTPEPARDPVMNAFLSYNDKELGGKGFVNWTPFKHPVLGEVEIGGIVPYADLLPDPSKADSLINVQVPWIFELARQIPSLNIESEKIEPQGAGIYRVSVWIRNSSVLPFPLAMGTRNKVPPPAIVTVKGKGISFLQGRERTALEGIGGSEQRRLTWLVKTEGETALTVRVSPVNARGSEKTIKLGGN